jgi:UTP:GlnB (protein PII) uridylyltransferase
MLTAHSKAVDDLLRTIWKATGQSGTCCLIAVGGYGRGLLYPYSDVDVLIPMGCRAGNRSQRPNHRAMSGRSTSGHHHTNHHA